MWGHLTTSLKKAIGQFMEDDCLTLAASLAYYTLFAMPPLLFLLVMMLSTGMSLVWEDAQAREQSQAYLQQQASHLIGNRAAAAEIGNIIENTAQSPGSWWKSLLSVAGVLVGATGLVAALQAALNRVWRVKPVSGSFAKQFLFKRLFSLAMILGFGFILLVSFAVSTALTWLSHTAADLLGQSGVAPLVINHIVGFLLTWTFFGFVLRFMPDAVVPWKHAAAGALLTVVLFAVGRMALASYLNTLNPTAQLGSAAASLVVILLWVYYSSISLLFGAEFTANLNTHCAQPVPGAVSTEV